MPYKRRSRYPTRRYRKKRYKKRYSRAMVPRSPTSLLGNKRKVQLKYHAAITLLSDISGNPNSHMFNAGSLFDPDVTGTGHQPRGFDQIMPLYSHYVVIHTKCSATFVQNRAVEGELDTLGQNVGIVLRHDATMISTANAILEDRNVSFRALAPFGSGGSVRITRTLTPKKFLGISHPLSQSELKGSSSSNPDESGFFQIFVAPIAYLFTQGEVQVDVNLVYTAIFIEPRDPGQS